MELVAVVEFIQQHGYFALFLSFYVCLLGLPIPNEVLVMMGGLLVATDYFHPVLTFLIVYVTVILNATILYWVGNTCGNRIICKLEKVERLNKKLTKASSLIHRYGSFAASFCYLLPIVRHLTPFLMGTYRISYHTFACFSYISGFVWTLALFLIGNCFSTKIDLIGKNLYVVGASILLLLCGMLVVVKMKKLLSHHFIRMEK
jgi:membrane protein DedA with SNARE-associated domain